MNKTRTLAAVGLAAASALLAAAPAQAGVIDGSLNDAHVLSSSVLGALMNSTQTGAGNDNANTRADGLLNDASRSALRPVQRQRSLRSSTCRRTNSTTCSGASSNAGKHPMR